ncbi:MAG: cytochrome c [Caldilineaceae bacterium]|nr:cytochrome c [Caldilineaceae bacterium]MBP8109033.1 cytochrome c [Caldilineaceae bacterium]MBP8125379.1 cytochrome c [Caldilineaceae bacterium]MBP9073993.1 cytochrome c [Caldilineaceae bacterium]
MKKVLIVIGSLIFIMALSGCGAKEAAPGVADAASDAAPTTVTEAAPSTGGGMMGMGGGMMARHSAPIPADYKGLSSPVPADEASLERGAQQYSLLCASCHGDGGMGDGPAGVALDPAPTAIAHTSQMMGDDYLFWRISEGGAFDPFNSSMISWKPVLNEEQRWDVINYVRALGTGQVQPGMGMGGAAFDPAAELAHRTEMIAAGVEQGLFAQAEGDAFLHVHDHMDQWRIDNPSAEMTGTGMEIQAATLAAMIAAGELEQADADLFNLVHEKLMDAGLMQ